MKIEALAATHDHSLGNPICKYSISVMNNQHDNVRISCDRQSTEYKIFKGEITQLFLNTKSNDLAISTLIEIYMTA